MDLWWQGRRTAADGGPGRPGGPRGLDCQSFRFFAVAHTFEEDYTGGLLVAGEAH